MRKILSGYLQLSLTPTAKRTLDIAASEAGRSVGEFVLESALARAEQTLADRRYFGLDAKHWERFITALDAPPQDIPALESLLREPSVFECSAD